MTIPVDSQQLESYVPVYDVIPDKWEEAKEQVVEQLKKLSIAVNSKEIGFFLDQELLSGKAFIPGQNNATDGGTSQSFRSILRKTFLFNNVPAGNSTYPHGITIDANFTLIQMFGSFTNANTFEGRPVPYGATELLSYNATNILISTVGNWDRCVVVMEYIQEL